jgi:hypothetical protein
MQEMYSTTEARNWKENNAKQIKNETNYRKNKEQVRNCGKKLKFQAPPFNSVQSPKNLLTVTGHKTPLPISVTFVINISHEYKQVRAETQLTFPSFLSN